MAKEMVNHPSHYGGADNVYEVIKIIDAYKLNFDLGNVIKYILRAGEKDDIIQDLEKAAWYLNHEIELIKKERTEANVIGDSKRIADQIDAATVIINTKNVKTLISGETSGR